MIKDDINALDFGFEDTFLDVHNLRCSWEKFKIPENLLVLTELYILRKRSKRDAIESEFSEHKI